MTWESRCGQYRVQESYNRYEKKTRYYALFKDGEAWSLIVFNKANYYFARNTAEEAVIKHHKRRIKEAKNAKPSRRKRKTTRK